MISVCMATYNGEKFIIRQLDSIIKQLDSNDQIVIVDDCSKDHTVQIIKDTYGDRVDVYINKKNIGPIKSFEKAISLANGDYIFLSDQDDIWEDNKVEEVLNAFINDDAMLVIHDALVVNGSLETIHPSWIGYMNLNINQGIIGNVIKNAFTGAMMAFKKELVNLILPFPPMIEMHDQWIGLACILEKQKITYVNKSLMKYVRHGGNVTGINKRPLSIKIKGRVKTLQAIHWYNRNK